MKNHSAIRAVQSGASVALETTVAGGFYDDHNDLLEQRTSYGLHIESAYALALELVTAANAAREQEVTAIRDQATRWGIKEQRSEQAIAEAIAKVPGPFVLAPARKLTEEEKAARAKAKEG